MEVCTWILSGILLLIILVLSVKIHLLRKSAKEIREALADRLMNDTNTLIDISGRDRHMRELAEDINRELRKLRDERHRFQQGDLELKDAVTNISHDLRTPLTAICGYLSLLEQEEKSETVERYLNVIENRTKVLIRLTEELFSYSIVKSEPDDSVFEEVVLNYVLEESISAYYGVLKGGRITPDIVIPEKKVVRSLNRNALSRIFGNMISNAVKYSDGDLKIVLEEDGNVIFSNHASSLDEVETGRLFDRFYTVETAKKSTGLGLSIAKVLTEQMGGSITAHYAEGMINIRIFFPEK